MSRRRAHNVRPYAPNRIFNTRKISGEIPGSGHPPMLGTAVLRDVYKRQVPRGTATLTGAENQKAVQFAWDRTILLCLYDEICMVVGA